jgi:hypothetical protein
MRVNATQYIWSANNQCALPNDRGSLVHRKRGVSIPSRVAFSARTAVTLRRLLFTLSEQCGLRLQRVPLANFRVADNPGAGATLVYAAPSGRFYVENRP